MNQSIEGMVSAAQPDESAFVVACAQRGEQGCAELLAHMYRGRLVFDHTRGAWYRITSAGYWREDATGATTNLLPNELAAKFLAIASELYAAGEQKRAEMAMIPVPSLRKRAGIDSVILRARCQPQLAITGDRWDCLSNEIAAANGVVSLTDGTVRQPRPDDYIRTHAPAEYQSIDAPAPRWLRFLGEVFGGDAALIDYVQRAAGYALTAACTERVLFVLHGCGANGKTTLLEGLNSVLGPYCYALTSEVLLESPQQRGDRPQPALFGLQGRRMVWASETGEGRALAAAQVKLLTGNDTLTVHSKYTKPVTFRPSHTLFLICNYLPRIHGDDQAVWDRLHCIPFTQRFVPEPCQPNEHPRDPRLLGTLKDEASGILAWCVRGAIAWHANGLQPPAAVIATTQEYRQNEDTIGRFISECTQHDAEALGDKAADVYAAYRAWCESNGHRALSANRFSQTLRLRGVGKTHTREGNRYDGLTITTGAL